MVLKTAWQPVHKWLALHRAEVLTLFRSAYATVIGAIVAAFVLLMIDMQWWLILYEFATRAGTISALLYVSTLVPGILKRFNIFPLVRASITLFRRQLGVLMFLTAGFHQAVMTTFPTLITNGSLDFSLLSQHEVYGSIAWWLLFPLWLTSNETSVKKLGRGWKWVHRLTYVALFFIYLHVATESEKLRWLFLVMMIGVASSWVYFWIQTARRKTANVPPLG